MKIDIFGDGISYVTNEMSSIHPSEANLSEFTREKFVTDLAAVSRGKDGAKNLNKIYWSLMNEAAPTSAEVAIVDFQNGEKAIGSPSRPLEFLPIVVDVQFGTLEAGRGHTSDPCIGICGEHLSIEDYANHFGGTFGFTQNNKLYTNMRALLNAGISYEAIPYNTAEELQDFRALKANIPMFVWGQVPNTHCALSKEAQSDRVTENVNYWLPSDFREKLYLSDFGDKKFAFEPLSKCQTKLLHFANRQEMVLSMINNYSQGFIQNLFKEMGYHQEVYSRAMYYFKYKEVVFTGWSNNPITFEHLFLERNANKDIWKNWTQSQTEIFVNAIKQIVKS